MFRPLRSITEGLQGVRSAVLLVADGLKGLGSDEGLEVAMATRVEALELSRAVWEAEMEGLLLKAENQYKASAAADARARTKARNDEDIFGQSPEERPASVEPPPVARLPERNVEAGPENGMSALQLGVEEDDKGAAYFMKWGR